jgi:hypothetical protein
VRVRAERSWGLINLGLGFMNQGKAWREEVSGLTKVDRSSFPVEGASESNGAYEGGQGAPSSGGGAHPPSLSFLPISQIKGGKSDG